MRSLVSCIIAVAIATTSVATQAGQTGSPNAADLAARLQKRYESIRDFTADFTQTYRGLLMRRTATESGKMLLKKPNRVRFTYRSPEHKEFVSDGSRFYSYFKSERAGSEHPLPKEDEASTALMFLAGRGNLARDFTASTPAEPAPAGEWHLRLVPRTRQADFETLTLFLDQRTLALRGFSTTDDQGTNVIRFSNLKENTGLADSAFLFKFPPGTEISK